ncbi:hypothetical protein QWZ04_08265 [Vibrio tapetis subsp. quintayensis]|uniref:hypothetical protein n=1 Tax=Vibrio tapetis TaxID=52443 RepID=UPI0025B5545E|nr:hypothetical protein [Vibrio tapetis]MDN3680318.1 hypothetical protein [Vibrio tapetis subsp. quintayensis]
MYQLELALIGGENPKEVPLQQVAMEMDSGEGEATEEGKAPIQLELDLQVN